MKKKISIIGQVKESSMKRAAYIFAVMATAVFTTGCVDADMTLTLEGHILAEAEVDEEAGTATCSVPGSSSEANLRAGRLSIDLDDIKNSGQFPYSALNRFNLNVVMTNRLSASDEYAPIGADQNLRTDQNWIQVEKFTVKYPEDQNQAGFSQLEDDFEFVAMVSSEEGFFFGGMPIIRPSNINTLETAVNTVSGGNANAIVPGMMEFQALGTTVGGVEVESNIMRLPFDVCNGCQMGTTPACAVQ